MTLSSRLKPEQNAIVIGASAGIGAAVAKRLAHEGYQVALVARRTELLEKVAAEINETAKTKRATIYPHDVTNFAEVSPLFQKILRDLGSIEVVVYVSGAMPMPGINEYNFEKDRVMIEVNTLGAMAWLGAAATLFDAQGSGHLVGVSSVAGDRGRVNNPGYGTSKAALSTYLEALRNRLTRKGVHVLTVKPGFVDTEMLRSTGRVTKMAISPEQAAKDIWHGIKYRRQEIYTPARWALIMFIIRSIPSFIFRRLSI